MKFLTNISLSLALIGILVLNGGFVHSPPAPEGKIQWLSIEEATALAQEDGKKILVDIYTDWCGWCKRMDKVTYMNPKVVDYINNNYHAVKFNAEQKGDVTVGGITYKYLPDAGRRGVHELAAKMLNGRMSYPATVFFEPNLSIITNVPGYQQPGDMMVILSFLAEDAFKKNISFDTYQKEYKSR